MLPHADRAIVPIEKLEAYALSPTSDRGKHKARVFESALGLTASDAAWLRERILDAVRVADAVETSRIEHGARYVVDFPLSTHVGTARVRTAWIVRNDETFPRLTSCRVL